MSKALALAFSKWIQSVIQAVRPFCSPDDLAKGSLWSADIHEALRDSNTGVLFVTGDNKDKPWLLFEAGALSVKLGKPCVIPLLFNIKPSDLTGPLAQLNAAVFSKEEVGKVVSSINMRLGDQRVSDVVLDSVYEKWWPDLEVEVDKILQSEVGAPPSRSQEDILNELLLLSRSIQSRLMRVEKSNRSRNIVSDLSTRFGTEAILEVIYDLPHEFQQAIQLVDLEGLTMSRAAAIVGYEPQKFINLYMTAARALEDKLSEHSKLRLVED